jgi:hypothetical protein
VPNPNESVDKKIYGSGQKSVINNSFPAARRGAIGDPIRANRSAAQGLNDSSTDQYYRSGGSKQSPSVPGLLVSPDGHGSAARPVAGAAWSAEAGIIRPLEVHDRFAIRNAAARIVELLNQNQPRVLVQVADPGFETDIRMHLNLAVGREELKDRYRLNDVAFELLPRTGEEIARQAFGYVTEAYAANVPPAGEDEPLPDDIAAFVKEGDVNELDGDTTFKLSPEAVAAVKDGATMQTKIGQVVANDAAIARADFGDVVVSQAEAGTVIGTPETLRKLAEAAPSFGGSDGSTTPAASVPVSNANAEDDDGD